MIKKLWIRFKEYFLYLLFGGLTTVVNYVVYIPLANWMKMPESQTGISAWLQATLNIDPESLAVLPANAIAWVAAVTFAYITNRKWVFESKTTGFKAVAKETGQFFGARLLTLVIEECLLVVFVVILHCNDLIVKIIASVITIIINYIFSKFIIFKKSKIKEQAVGGEQNSEELTEIGEQTGE